MSGNRTTLNQVRECSIPLGILTQEPAWVDHLYLDWQRDDRRPSGGPNIIAHRVLSSCTLRQAPGGQMIEP